MSTEGELGSRDRRQNLATGPTATGNENGIRKEGVRKRDRQLPGVFKT